MSHSKPRPSIDAAHPSQPAAPRIRRRSALEWTLHAGEDASMAAADWLAADLSPSGCGALPLLSDRSTPVEVLRAAKDAFKTMRVMGEHVADRRLGARLYLGAIAAALAHHGVRISSQCDEALVAALREMRDDVAVHEPLRHLANSALRALAARAGRHRA